VWKYGRHPLGPVSTEQVKFSKVKKKEEEEERNKPQGKNIMACPIT